MASGSRPRQAALGLGDGHVEQARDHQAITGDLAEARHRDTDGLGRPDDVALVGRSVTQATTRLGDSANSHAWSAPVTSTAEAPARSGPPSPRGPRRSRRPCRGRPRAPLGDEAPDEVGDGARAPRGRARAASRPGGRAPTPTASPTRCAAPDPGPAACPARPAGRRAAAGRGGRPRRRARRRGWGRCRDRGSRCRG